MGESSLIITARAQAKSIYQAAANKDHTKGPLGLITTLKNKAMASSLPELKEENKKAQCLYHLFEMERQLKYFLNLTIERNDALVLACPNAMSKILEIAKRFETERPDLRFSSADIDFSSGNGGSMLLFSLQNKFDEHIVSQISRFQSYFLNQNEEFYVRQTNDFAYTIYVFNHLLESVIADQCAPTFYNGNRLGEVQLLMQEIPVSKEPFPTAISVSVNQASGTKTATCLAILLTMKFGQTRFSALTDSPIFSLSSMFADAGLNFGKFVSFIETKGLTDLMAISDNYSFSMWRHGTGLGTEIQADVKLEPKVQPMRLFGSDEIEEVVSQIQVLQSLPEEEHRRFSICPDRGKVFLTSNKHYPEELRVSN